MTNPFLIGAKIYLRAPEPGDEKIYALSQNHPEPRDQLFFAIPSSLETQRSNILKYTDDPGTINFTICSISPDTPIGNSSFFRIDWVGRMAIYYIAIAESENWSKGYGLETTQLMVEYAFKTLNLNRIQLHVHVDNKRAVNVYKKVGFRNEGTLRQAMFHDDRYYDFYVMGILHADWKAKISK